MPEAFLDMSLRGDRAGAARLLGLTVHPEWWGQMRIAAIRLDQLRRDPAYDEWSLRAIGLRATGEMVGHIGFHTRPDPLDLRQWVAGGIEFGYTVYTTHRRMGIATEAASGLMRWAHEARGINHFVLSISPSNAASLRVAARLGFTRVGSHQDEIDGLEDVFVVALRAPAEPAAPN
jgi:RimJ/RimL family protein N-acetyltransferase